MSDLVSINDAKNEPIPKVNVPEQSLQSISIPKQNITGSLDGMKKRQKDCKWGKHKSK